MLLGLPFIAQSWMGTPYDIAVLSALQLGLLIIVIISIVYRSHYQTHFLGLKKLMEAMEGRIQIPFVPLLTPLFYRPQGINELINYYQYLLITFLIYLSTKELRIAYMGSLSYYSHNNSRRWLMLRDSDGSEITHEFYS